MFFQEFSLEFFSILSGVPSEISPRVSVGSYCRFFSGCSLKGSLWISSGVPLGISAGAYSGYFSLRSSLVLQFSRIPVAISGKVPPWISIAVFLGAPLRFLFFFIYSSWRDFFLGIYKRSSQDVTWSSFRDNVWRFSRSFSDTFLEKFLVEM